LYATRKINQLIFG